MKWRLDAGQIEVMDANMALLLRAKRPCERIAMIGQANRTAREMLFAAVRRRHPELDQTAIRRHVARRMLGHGTT